MFTRYGRARVGAVGLLVAVAVGCGDDDDDAATSDTTAAAVETTAAAATTAAASAVDDTSAETTTAEGAMTVSVNAVDYAFEDLPASVPAGTALSLTNSSQAEVHELVAFRLPDDEERPVADLVVLPEAELGALFGTAEPAMVVIAPPGEAGFPVVGDGTLTEPGRYAVMCFIPIGAVPEEYLAAAEAATEGPPQVAGGPPHFTAGMFAEVVVE